MKIRETNSGLQPKNVLRVAAVTAFLLLIPFVAMKFNWQVTDPGNPNPETVNWNLFDFIVMGLLLMSLGLVYEILASRVKTITKRAIIGLALLAIFFLLWAEMAVGIFGSLIAGY